MLSILNVEGYMDAINYLWGKTDRDSGKYHLLIYHFPIADYPRATFASSLSNLMVKALPKPPARTG